MPSISHGEYRRGYGRSTGEISLSAQNSWTPAVPVFGPFDFSLSGTFVATVFIQRSKDAGVTWRDVNSYQAPLETSGTQNTDGYLYRAGIKTGGYTSGTVVVEIAQ